MKCEFERQNADWKRKSEFFCSMDGRVKLCNFHFAIFMGFPLLLRCSLWYNRNIKRKQKITY